MNRGLKSLFFFISLALLSTPYAHARARVNEPGGDGGVHANPSSSAERNSSSQASSVRPADNGVCQAGYRCMQCEKI